MNKQLLSKPHQQSFAVMRAFGEWGGGSEAGVSLLTLTRGSCCPKDGDGGTEVLSEDDRRRHQQNQMAESDSLRGNTP